MDEGRRGGAVAVEMANLLDAIDDADERQPHEPARRAARASSRCRGSTSGSSPATTRASRAHAARRSWRLRQAPTQRVLRRAVATASSRECDDAASRRSRRTSTARASLSPVERAILLDRRLRADAPAGDSVSRRDQRGGRARQELRRHRRPQVRQRRARQARATCARRRLRTPRERARPPDRRRSSRIAMTNSTLIDALFRARGAPERPCVGVGDDGARLAPDAGHGPRGHPPTCWSKAGISSPTPIPRALGHKALAVNLSDLAAMGATPRWALLAVALPDADEALARGVRARASSRSPTRFGVELDRRRHDARAAQPLRHDHRRSARGHGAHARSARAPATTSGCRARWATRRSRSPRSTGRIDARCRRARRAARCGSSGPSRASRSASGCAASPPRRSTSPTACAGDLGHILERRGVGARRRATRRSRVRRARARSWRGDERELALACLLAGGDDYELCFTAPPAMRDADRGDRARARPAAHAHRRDHRRRARLDRARRARRADARSLPRAFDHFAA